MDETTKSGCYEIRIGGLLGELLLGAFPGLHAETEGSETVLTGELSDQAALHGVLAQIEALGLELLEVRRRRSGSVGQEERPARSYLLGADESERLRLLAQGEIHRAEAEALFDRIEIPAGGRAVDFGCGPLGVLDLLSCRVGPAGEVVGLDSEPRMIGFAQRSVAERGLANVKLVRADAGATGLDANSFDLAHERLVLVNHISPQDVVAEMARVVRPGGWVVLENVDWLTWICEPPHPAWDSLMDALVQTWGTLGLDPFMGRRMPAFLRGAGLVDAAIEVRPHSWRPGEPNQLLLLRFIDIFRDQIVDGGFLDAPGLARLAVELEEHLSRPETFVMHPLLFQAWGRKPG